jgi:hypothetical protein
MRTRRRRSILVVAITLAVAGCGTADPGLLSPEATSTESGMTPGASLTASVTTEPGGTLESALPSADEATPPPTATPAPTVGPTPRPTLDWSEPAIGVSVTPNPAQLGKKITISVVSGAGPICTLKVKYPSGASASLPSPTRPNPRTWAWTWTLPLSAQPGTGHFTETCTYAGKTAGGTNAFLIAGMTWSISATLPASFLHTETLVSAQITIHGTWPGNPNTEQRLSCILDLVTSAGTTSGGANIFFYPAYGLGPFDEWLVVGPLPAAAIGPATWKLRCSNPNVDPGAFQYDHGTIEIT